MKTCKKYLLTMLLLGIASIAHAATVDDLKVCSHSYVMVADDYTNNGTGSRTKGGLFGDAFFLDVTGGSVATNKGATDLSVVDSLGADQEPLFVTQEIVDKYGEYGKHLQSLRLKNAQDVIAMRVTAGSKLIFFIHGNNKSGTAARIPKIATDAKMENVLNAAPDADFPATVTGFRYEWTADDDRLIYIGSYNGDMYVSYIIVEVNEAEGSPSVKVGEQTFENGLWYREVICRPSLAYGMSTIVTYTTDGTEPTTTSPVYTEPIKVYKDATLKFQAFMDLGTGSADASAFLPGADNQANVNFKFDAPTIDVDGATVTITSPYEGAENYILVNGNNEKKANSITLEESATITAYSKIINGEYAEFTSNSTSQDVYVLNPIKEKKIITATGTVVLDEEASEYYTTPIYKVEGGAISANKKDFFVKNLTLNVLKDEKAQYQVPEGQEIYIQMSNTNITFMVAEGDSVDVKVVCSKNSCRMLENWDESMIDRKCYVNVSGTIYGTDDITVEGANIITFGLPGGIHTFQKYSGTGNILISSIEITPVGNGQQVTERNSLYIADGHRFSTAKTNMLPISLRNEDDILGFQLDVVLPQGMTIAKNEKDKNIVTIKSDRTDTHTLSTRVLDDGSIRIVGTSIDNDALYGNDGVLLELGINIASWVENGDYAIQLKDVKLTNADKNTIVCSDKVFYVTVGGKLGDVNCDDAIDVTDAVLIIDEILMKSPANFDASLADVNYDGSIDVTDVVMVIDAILGKITLARGAEASQKDLSAYTAFQMDLTVPAGYVFEGVELTEIAKDSHKLAYNMLADGRCRVVVFSMDNEALPGAWDEVIRLNLKGQGETYVNVDRAMFVTVGGERHELLLNGTTSIAQLSTLNSQFSIVYDLQGRKVEKTAKGVYVIDGKKVVK